MVERKCIGQFPPQKERKHSKIEEEDIAGHSHPHPFATIFHLVFDFAIAQRSIPSAVQLASASLPSLLLLVKRCSCLLRRSIILSQVPVCPSPLPPPSPSPSMPPRPPPNSSYSLQQSLREAVIYVLAEFVR